MSDRGYNYLGSLDDMVEKYPWRFRIDEEYIKFALARQTIEGRPVLINDGYLVNHPECRKQIPDTNSFINLLIEKGHMFIMARGYGKFGIHEIPEKMAHIRSMRQLIDSGEDWLKLRGRLEEIDQNHSLNIYRRWPVFDSKSGFLVFADRLLSQSQQSGFRTAQLGLGSAVRSDAFKKFIFDFVQAAQRTERGPRDLWEEMAENMAASSQFVLDPELFKLRMMQLANEIYHLNIGVGLSSTYDTPVSVETKTSAAFDDLIVTPHVIVESNDQAEEELRNLTKIPVLRTPRAVANVPPSELVKVLDPDTPLGSARVGWVDAVNRLQELSTRMIIDDRDRRRMESARESATYAAEEYAARISEAFASYVRLNKTEELFSVELGEVASATMKPALKSLGGSAVGVAAAKFGIGDLASNAVAGAVGSLAIAVIVARARKRVNDTIVRRFKIGLVRGDTLPPGARLRSEKALAALKQRTRPSSLDLRRDLAQEFTSRMTRFK